MREFLRYPILQAARTAKSLRLMSEHDLHRMGILHIQHHLIAEGYEILFCNDDLGRYPQLKAYREDEALLWVVVHSAMYPDEPSLPKMMAKVLLDHASEEDALIRFASVSFVNTRSTVPSLASANGLFKPRLVRFEEIDQGYLRQLR
ncbi:MAG TPA: hypothetical protein VJ869_04940 [Sphaerochaeta sp.]|nr:hypothetical protein [Sphaerochaeta sp.]